MDPLTQGTVGAAAAICGARPGHVRSAALAGALAGVLPDADVLIRSSSDPLLFLDYHRHFTHALAFVPVGATIAAGLCVVLSRGRARFRSVWWPCLLGYATHGLLDACTSYGTFLWWPFSNERVAWHVVSIVDPLFTLPLLAAVLLAVWWRRRALGGIAVAFGLAYLALGTWQHGRARDAAEELVARRGHVAERAVVKPSFANNVVWRALYLHEGRYYADAVRVPWIGTATVYEGSSVDALDREDLAVTGGLHPVATADLARFAYFSADWIIEDPRHPGLVSDFRYAMVPNEVGPLWGVDLAGTPPGEHLRFVQLQTVSDTQKASFLRMLRGR